jgi:hypothetical protein
MRAARFLWLVAALLLIGAAGWRNDPLRALRRELHISQADPFENAPPLMAFTTVAMGGFRGILADLLWLRAARLQEEGKYFELVQLADWITKLEPRFTTVWAYQAWNLAYNISVLFDNPEDRWRWVSNGVRLLRDEGLKYNPGDARLLYELGWIFQHKIGGDTDQMHSYYKRAWAAEMSALFDGPRPIFEAVKADLAAESEAGRRARRMRDEHKLDPAVMEQVDTEFGPLDWRLPQAQAIYWAFRSRRVASGFDAVAAERMIFQSMADALVQGSLFTSGKDDVFILAPNLALLPRVRGAYERAIEEHPDQDAFRTAHRNFLTHAVVLLFTYHRERDARSVYDDLKRRYPDAAGSADFERFVLRSLAGDLKDMRREDALAFVEADLVQSLFWRAYGESERAEGFQARAALIWQSYMRERTTAEFKERTGLPPIEEIRKVALSRLKEQFADSAAISELR